MLDPAFDLPRGTIARITNVQHSFWRQRAKLLAERVHRRFVLDGHGDQRPEHIWLNPPFPIRDRLEFDSRLRASDALDEIAFLHLECARLGERWVGEELRRHLGAQLDDDPSRGLFLFYRIGRAMLRAVVDRSSSQPSSTDQNNVHVWHAPISHLQERTLRSLSGS